MIASDRYCLLSNRSVQEYCQSSPYVREVRCQATGMPMSFEPANGSDRRLKEAPLRYALAEYDRDDQVPGCWDRWTLPSLKTALGLTCSKFLLHHCLAKTCLLWFNPKAVSGLPTLPFINVKSCDANYSTIDFINFYSLSLRQGKDNRSGLVHYYVVGPSSVQISITLHCTTVRRKPCISGRSSI